MSSMDNVPLPPPYLIPPRRGPHQAVFMPDILVVILDYALQPSVEELRHRDLRRTQSWLSRPNRKTYSARMGPLLVCRLWQSVGQRAVFRCMAMTMEVLSFNCPAKFPHPLLQVARIHLSLPSSFSLSTLQDHADPLLAHLNRLMSDSLTTAKSQLREVCLTNPFPMLYLPLICNIAQLRNQLTLLELSSGNITGVPVHRLLSPSAENVDGQSIYLPNLRHLLLHGIEIDPIPDEFLRDSATCLTTLRLDRVRVQLHTLQTLLLGIAGPALKQLSLGVFDALHMVLFATTFLDTWMGLCRNLDWFQIRGTEDEPSTLTLLSHPFCVRAEWLEWMTTPKMMGAMVTIDIRLGRLDISGRTIYDQRISRLLHQFLCEDAAAHGLQELTIPAIRFNAAIFDPMWVHADVIPPGTWACSSLQKLVVAFMLPQHTDDRMTRYIIRRTYAQYAKASRLACGFVVTSCPQLVTLDIGFLGKAFDLDPEGGLCFLGRLQHLEHLTWRQPNGLTQSFPHVYANALGRRPWPYDSGRQWSRQALVQAQKVAIPWFDAKVQELSLPVLQWMSTDPKDEDIKKKLSNLARCRYLYRQDNDVMLAVKLTVQGRNRRSKSGVEWQRQLEAMLTNKAAKEGALWRRLKTLTCHAEAYDCNYHPSNHKEKGAFYDAFVKCYARELQLVLPDVQIEFV
ncbi:hypothetical protein BGZ73_008048 [Actinomortierella ambigua]|nr:hypothetical protein BGZ73_008048 [Actinomortierella ambigua]